MQYLSSDSSLPSVLAAAQHEPVTVRDERKDVAVVLSVKDYNRMRAANLAEFDQVCAEISAAAQSRGLTEAKLAEILAD